MKMKSYNNDSLYKANNKEIKVEGKYFPIDVKKCGINIDSLINLKQQQAGIKLKKEPCGYIVSKVKLRKCLAFQSIRLSYPKEPIYVYSQRRKN